MNYYDTFDEEGVFLSSEDEHDVHYKGLWHKVVRVWLYDTDGNIYLRIRKNDKKYDSINELHMLSSESVSSCFDRGMFEKLGIHFPATSNLDQAFMRKVKIHRVYSDNSELRDNYFLCDYIGEFDKNTNFFIFSQDTEGLVKANAKGILNLLSTRTGEVIGNLVLPGGNNIGEKTLIKIENIYENSNEDTYTKYSHVINAIVKEAAKLAKEKRENEKLKKFADKHSEQMQSYKSHADENDSEIY